MSLTVFPESQLYQEVINGTYVEEPEIERLMEMRTLIDRLNIRVNLLGHHVSNTVPITGALPDDKDAILREFDKAIANFPEKNSKPIAAGYGICEDTLFISGLSRQG